MMNWLSRMMIPGLVCVILTGCDRPPGPVIGPDGKTVEVMSVNPEDAQEVAAVQAAESARALYAYRLDVLMAYYQKIGHLDKFRATQKEIDNLKTAQYFRWQGFEAVAPEGQRVQNADQRLLVEDTIAARNEWLASLDALAGFYSKRKQTFKARVVESVSNRFNPVHRYTYFLDAEIPGSELRPTDHIPEAEALYNQAVRLHQQGKGVLHTFVTTDYQKQKQALVLFRQLIQEYPTSTRIALSAYYIADIYKEYCDEDIRAVRWYERAWQWDPNITEPARFQAATVYDYRLSNPRKAIELYEQSLKHDPWRLLNPQTAQQRIKELRQSLPAGQAK